jgi:hypothetical protein
MNHNLTYPLRWQIQQLVIHLAKINASSLKVRKTQDRTNKLSKLNQPLAVKWLHHKLNVKYVHYAIYLRVLITLINPSSLWLPRMCLLPTRVMPLFIRSLSPMMPLDYLLTPMNISSRSGLPLMATVFSMLLLHCSKVRMKIYWSYATWWKPLQLRMVEVQKASSLSSTPSISNNLVWTSWPQQHFIKPTIKPPSGCWVTPNLRM